MARRRGGTKVEAALANLQDRICSLEDAYRDDQAARTRLRTELLVVDSAANVALATAGECRDLTIMGFAELRVVAKRLFGPKGPDAETVKQIDLHLKAVGSLFEKGVTTRLDGMKKDRLSELSKPRRGKRG